MATKLKALRAQIGSYGRVAANGIIEVDENLAEQLVKSGRFVKATAADIKAAQAAQHDYLTRINPEGVPGFPPLPGSADAVPAEGADDEAGQEKTQGAADDHGSADPVQAKDASAVTDVAPEPNDAAADDAPGADAELPKTGKKVPQK